MSIAERFASLERGENPLMIGRMRSGFAVMADSQYLPGYCLLLAHPQVGQLNDLSVDKQAEFLADMAALGGAVREATGCRRINYGIYGNVDPFLHVHVVPRYKWEPADTATLPPLSIPEDLRSSIRYEAGRDDALRDRIRELLALI